MQLVLKFLLPLVAAQRDINNPEYQSFSKRALQPSFQWNFEEYQFKKIGDLETFLPIDDDTWGEFLIKQKGHNGKFNFLQHRIMGNHYGSLSMRRLYFYNTFSLKNSKFLREIPKKARF